MISIGSQDYVIGRCIRELKISPKLLGYMYLCEAIEIIQKDFNAIYNLTKGIYSEIGDKYFVSIESIEISIRRAIDSSWKKDRENIKNKFETFFLTEITKKPTPTEVLTYLNWRVELEKKKTI